MAKNYDEAVATFLQANPALGTLSKTLGSGNFGTAYLTSKNLVVKITNDAAEFSTAQAIKQKANGKYTPAFHELTQLKAGVYALVMDLVQPIQLTASESQMLNLFRDKVTQLLEDGENPAPIKQNLKRLNNPKLEQLLSGLIDCMAGLHSVGILDTDIHEDNIGTVGGRVVLFDVVEDSAVLHEALMRHLGILGKLLGVLRG